MTPALLALALAVADPLGFPSPPAVAPAAAASGPASPAQPTAASPARAAGTPALTLPASGPGLDQLILPVAVLLALAIGALLLGRRRQQAARLVQVLETTSIGPKRALVVARVGDELLIIGSSEAGLALLAARPAGLEPRPAEAPARLVALPDPAPEAAPVRGVVLGLLSRLRGGGAARPAARPEDGFPGLPAFDALLAESAEDQELRRKLAMGHPGSVR